MRTDESCSVVSTARIMDKPTDEVNALTSKAEAVDHNLMKALQEIPDEDSDESDE
jgi:hypothetical protein